jgi:hypothetical protein
MASNDNDHRQGMNADGRQRARRGFAAMDGDLQRRIARKGGVASSKAQARDAHGQFRGSNMPPSSSS